MQDSILHCRVSGERVSDCDLVSLFRTAIEGTALSRVYVYAIMAMLYTHSIGNQP